jgi:hypothetical protein
VPEVDSVADGQCAGVIHEHLVAPIVFCCGADVESFLTAGGCGKGIDSDDSHGFFSDNDS